MKLSSITIKNFRSIKDLTLNMSYDCKVLVGKNESGKSNILKALALLGKGSSFSNEDIRESLPDEAVISESYVEFAIKLDTEDFDTIYNSVSEKVLSKKPSCPIVKTKSDQLTIEQICKQQYSGLYTINLFKKSAQALYYEFGEDWTILDNWRKPSEAGLEYTIELDDDTEITLEDYGLINLEDYPDIPEENLERLTINDINELIGSSICEVIENGRPETIFWYYQEKFLLPPKINLDQFAKDPNTCMPLKSMFQLAGLENPGKAIKDAQSRQKHSLKNLLDRVAHITTNHFQNVWKEYKAVSFELSLNGENIDASVKDSFNSFDLSQRSDGFKRFVCFLLLISAKVESKLMKNTLLLLDEPDICLHPSGAKYLRDELIKIAKNNYVFYTTHSIFMIDNDIVNRHLLVTKDKEKTIVNEVNESNYVDEEVIYNALGYSIFENLNKNCIIFEGWKDKKIFEIALSKVPQKYKDVKKLKDFGLCHVKGVKQIKNIAPLLELAKRSYIVLSDGDKAAKENQLEYFKLNYAGQWKRYDELLPEVFITTVEDFIKPSTIVKVLDDMRKDIESLPIVKEEALKDPRGSLWVIDECLKSIIPDKEIRKNTMERFKNNLFEQLRSSDILESYFEMMLSLNNTLNFTENKNTEGLSAR